jgi:hypothetical protein
MSFVTVHVEKAVLVVEGPRNVYDLDASEPRARQVRYVCERTGAMQPKKIWPRGNLGDRHLVRRREARGTAHVQER